MPYIKEKIELAVAEAELRAAGGFRDMPAFVKIAVFILPLLMLPAYFSAKILSKAYYEKQYEKFRIQAGPSFTQSEPLLVSPVELVRVGDNTYSASALVTNQNLNLASRSFKYRFKFLDQSGGEMVPVSGQTEGSEFILPDQKKYVTALRLVFDKRVLEASLEILSEPTWQMKPELPKVNIVIEPAKTTRQSVPPAFVAEGYMQNSSAYMLKKVRLIFFVRDAAGNLINISQRDEFDLRPLERRAYKQLWPGFEPSGLVKVNVVAETNLLDAQNLKLEALPGSSSSDLSRPELQAY